MTLSQFDSLSIEKLSVIGSVQSSDATRTFEDLWKQTFSSSDTDYSSVRSSSTSPSVDGSLLSSLRSNSSIRSIDSRYSDINPRDEVDFNLGESVELEVPFDMEFPNVPEIKRSVSAPAPVTKAAKPCKIVTKADQTVSAEKPSSKAKKENGRRFSDLKPSGKFHRFRSTSRTSPKLTPASGDQSDSEKAKPWRPRRRVSSVSSDSGNSKSWRPRRMSEVSDVEKRPSRELRRSSMMTTYPPRFGSKLRDSKLPSKTRLTRSESLPTRPRDWSGVREAVGETGRRDSNRFKRHVVEVTGDPAGVADGKYFYTEKYCRKPYFTRHKPFKGTLAPRASHGMWFLLAWGENGVWTDYCASSRSELPPTDGWRKCWRNKDKKTWRFGEAVPTIKVNVLEDAYPTYT